MNKKLYFNFRVSNYSLALAILFFWIQDSLPQSNKLFVHESMNRVLIKNIKSFDDPTIINRAYVSVNFELLNSMVETYAQIGEGTMIVNFSRDSSFIVQLDRIEIQSHNFYTLLGHVRGEPSSQVAFVINNRKVIGNIRLPSALYQIRYAGQAFHAILLIDESVFPSEAGPIVPEYHKNEITPYSTEGTFEDGLDLMVVYTEDARIDEGGHDAIQALIQLAVVETNIAFTKSLINATLRLVYSGEVDYQETNNIDLDLRRLKDPTDSYLNEVHSLRDTYRADLVCLFVANEDTCGNATVMDKLVYEFREHAFSVVKKDCAASNYTLAHELGHNMGCAHDRANARVSGVFSYSYGYQDPSGSFRTIMAYDCPNRCGIIQHFSNPKVKYDNRPTGIDESEDPDRAADCARTLNNTIPFVATFRNSIDRLLFSGGNTWGDQFYATSIAFGDIDGDGFDEIGIARYASINDRYFIYDDATTDFTLLFTGGGNWGESAYATSIAFGDVDGDGFDEVGITRHTVTNNRFLILDDANNGFTTLFSDGNDWARTEFATFIAFGDVDGDGLAEFGIGRNAAGGHRYYLYDDASNNFAQLLTGGDNWGQLAYTTSIAFGDVDGDGLDEVGITRHTVVNDRYLILDDANNEFANIFTGGNDWAESEFATSIAFGDADGDGLAEFGIGRKGATGYRYFIFDDANSGFTQLLAGGNSWGERAYTTSIAFGDVDRDGRDEIGIMRTSILHHRFTVLDDATRGFRGLLSRGWEWGDSDFAISVAFGNIDSDEREEIGVTRKTSTDARYYVMKLNLDDSIGTSVKLSPVNQQTAFSIQQNYPNPFNPYTTINYRLTKSSEVNLIIYNQLGQRIRALVESKQVAGVHNVNWDGRNDKGLIVPSGVYFYRLKAEEFLQSRKMLLLR